jgi:hypothetical protein
LQEVLAAVGGRNAVESKLHVGGFGSFAETGCGQTAMELAQWADALVQSG